MARKTKKRRTPAQIRATKKLVALNKKRRLGKKVTRKKRAVVVTPKKKRRSTIIAKKRRKTTSTQPRKYVRRKKIMAKKRRTRNTTKSDFTGTIINGAIAGAGAISGSMATNAIGKILNLNTPQQRNVLNLGLAFGAAYFLPKVIGKEPARSLSDGMFAIAMASLAQTALGKNLISLGEDPVINQYGLSAIETPLIEDDYSDFGAIIEPDYEETDYELGQEDYIMS